MHDWLATHVRMTFSRAVSLQIGGDAHGMRRTIEYRAASRGIGDGRLAPDGLTARSSREASALLSNLPARAHEHETIGPRRA